MLQARNFLVKIPRRAFLTGRAVYLQAADGRGKRKRLCGRPGLAELCRLFRILKSDIDQDSGAHSTIAEESDVFVSMRLCRWICWKPNISNFEDAVCIHVKRIILFWEMGDYYISFSVGSVGEVFRIWVRHVAFSIIIQSYNQMAIERFFFVLDLCLINLNIFWPGFFRGLFLFVQ